MTENNLDHFAFNDKPLEEFFKTKKKKEIESVYQDEISTNSNKNPVRFGKPKFKSKKERNGIVKKLTPEEYYNQDPNGNFGKCSRIKDVVISLLLSGINATSKELFFEIDKLCDRNVEIKSIISKEIFNLDKIYTIMWQIKKSVLGRYLILTPKGSNKRVFSYSLMEDAKSFTLEKSIEFSKKYKKGLRKSVIKKAVKKSGEQIKNETRLKKNVQDVIKAQLQIMMQEFIIKAGGILQKEYKESIEVAFKEIRELKELVNQLMINTPASELKSSLGIVPDKLEVEVKGGVEVSFRIDGLG